MVFYLSMKNHKETHGGPVKKECHSGHRKRMRQRYRDTGLSGFHPHEVLKLLLFDAIPRANTNDLAHALLEKREEELAAVLLAPPSVPGVGEKTQRHLCETGERMERLFLESIAHKFGKSQLHTAALWYLRRFPDRVLLVITDAEDRLVTRELPDKTEFADTFARCMSQLEPGQFCHLAMCSALGIHTDLPEDDRVGMILILNERWQIQWVR